jgi:hypothetical protein
MADPNADERLAACKKRFYSAKDTGDWQKWISESENPWSNPPWRPLGAAVVHAQANTKSGDIATLARDFCNSEVLRLERSLNERREQKEAEHTDQITVSFDKVRRIIHGGPNVCREFVDFVCRYELQGPPETTRSSSEAVAPLNAYAESVRDTAPSVTERRAAVDAYIEEVWKTTGKRITRTDIWRSARYKSRTEFERWQRHDPKATKTASDRFTRILAEKPHLK